MDHQQASYFRIQNHHVLLQVKTWHRLSEIRTHRHILDHYIIYKIYTLISIYMSSMLLIKLRIFLQTIIRIWHLVYLIRGQMYLLFPCLLLWICLIHFFVSLIIFWVKLAVWLIGLVAYDMISVHWPLDSINTMNLSLVWNKIFLYILPI